MGRQSRLPIIFASKVTAMARIDYVLFTITLAYALALIVLVTS